MSKVIEIENAIVSMGQGEFQKLCDTILSKKGKYGLIHGLGMKTGTAKSTIGNPDTYFRREDGKYVFAVYTTQQDHIYKKIKEDIEKCFEPEQTGVQIDDIAEIVCCHTSSNLSAGNDKKLHEICSVKGIKLTIFGPDELAQQIYGNYLGLARNILGISIGTNQIVELDDFIKLYDESKTAAPLDTVFQCREELDAVTQSIRENDAVIVYGHAGVGKTRIVIEAIKDVASEDGYHILCVKNNNLPINEDLITHLDRQGRYLFFVDDANEFNCLNHVLNYVNKENYTFKLIVTVRDYAMSGVISEVGKRVQPSLVEITAVADEKIKAFLDTSLGIKNDQFVDAIVQVAEGNLRIAYMAGQIAVESNSLAAVHDVTQVYEQYYASVVDSKIGNDRELCLTAGVLSLVKAVMLDRLDYLKEILEVAGLDLDSFRINIDRLSSMEVVEVHMDKVAAISDQCLANYMLYYVFFSRKMMPFSVVLTNGFLYFKDGVVQSLNTLLNIFCKNEVREYIKDEVKKSWWDFRDNNPKYYEEFAKLFHIFNPIDAFIIARNIIDRIPQKPLDGRHIDFNGSTFRGDADVLEFLTGYRATDHMETVVDLFLEFSKKSVENTVAGMHWLQNNYGIDIRELNVDCYDEILITNKLLENLDSSEYIQQLALEYIKYALDFEFKAYDVDHSNAIRMYRLQIPNSNGVKEYRNNCWSIIKKLLQTANLNDEVYSVIGWYAKSACGAKDTGILSDDKPYIEEIVKLLKNNPIQTALLVQEIQSVFQAKKIDITLPTECFELQEWKLYEILDNSNDLELPVEDYQENRDARLEQYANSIDTENVRDFLDTSKSLLDWLENKSDFSVSNGLKQIIQSICNNSEMATVVYNYLVHDGCNVCGIEVVLPSIFKIIPIDQIWKDISSVELVRRNEWQFRFFSLIPEDLVDDSTYQLMMSFLQDDSDKEIKSVPYRGMRFLDKFMNVDRNIYVNASRIILKKKEYDGYITQIYFTLLFNEYSYKPKEVKDFFSCDLDLLRDIYFLTVEMDSLVDVKGIFFAELVKDDEGWINAYADVVCNSIKNHGEQNIRIYLLLWQSDAYMSFFDRVFFRICENSSDYIYGWWIEEAFGEILSHPQGDNEMIERQEEWVTHTVNKYIDSPNIVILFKALSGTSQNLRKRAFQEFLSLNDNYEDFANLPLDPDHFGGMEGEIVSDLNCRIDFLKSLLEDVRDIKYLEHAQRIQSRIDMWEKQIKEEEMQGIYRKLYR